MSNDQQTNAFSKVTQICCLLVHVCMGWTGSNFVIQNGCQGGGVFSVVQLVQIFMEVHLCWYKS